MEIVAHADTRPASRKNASDSRRAGLRSCRSDAHRRRSWTRPFRRTRRAIECSMRLISSSCRVIEAAQRFAAGRPVRAARQLELVSGWMSEAGAQLQCAARALQETIERAAQSPDVALDAPAKLTHATAQWIEAAGLLAAFSERLDGTSAWLVDSVKSGVIPIPPQEQTADAGETVTTFRLIPPPLVPPEWFPYQSNDVPCIPVRRQRSICPTVAEAARRIFRGRAPPLVSTCSL
jgi:hypothetical protein